MRHEWRVLPLTLGNKAPSQAGDDRLRGSQIECRAVDRHGAATHPALESGARVYRAGHTTPRRRRSSLGSRTDPVATIIPDRRGTGFGFSIPNHGNADQDPDNQTPVRIRGKDSITKKIRLTKRTAPNVVTIVLSGCLRSYF
jgi:hypothetical protein